MIRLLPLIKQKKHIIFDYNGTILYDTDVCVEVLNLLLDSHGRPPVNEAYYREHFHFPISSFYTKMGFDFERESFDQLGRRYMNIYLDNIHRCKVYHGLRDLIRELRQDQDTKKISILTALNHDALLAQLKSFDLEQYFDATFGLYDHHALSKVQRGHDLMKHVGIPAEDTIIIGDTDHDLEVAHSLGIDAILLGDGHQNEERLKKTKAKVVNLNRQTE